MRRGAGGGGALGDHYAAMVRSGRRAAPKPPSLPHGTAHIWNTFCRLDAKRRSNGFGPEPISYSEIEAYLRVTGESLDPWEVKALAELDDQYIEAAAKKE